MAPKKPTVKPLNIGVSGNPYYLSFCQYCLAFMYSLFISHFSDILMLFPWYPYICLSNSFHFLTIHYCNVPCLSGHRRNISTPIPGILPFFSSPSLFKTSSHSTATNTIGNSKSKVCRQSGGTLIPHYVCFYDSDLNMLLPALVVVSKAISRIVFCVTKNLWT